MNAPNLGTGDHRSHPVATRADDTALAEIGGDLQASLAGFMDGTTEGWHQLLADLEHRYEYGGWRATENPHERLVGVLEYTRYAVRALDRMASEGPSKQDHLTPADFQWHQLAEAWRHDDAGGRALWERIQQTAREELREGRAGAVAIEGHDERPMARAEYLAVWLALADGLTPQNGAERLLIDGMAQALIMQRHWLTRMVQTESLDTIRQGHYRHGSMPPPRLTEAEAVDRAAAMQDRFHRQFLRLVKAYRDQRRVFSTLVVAGGQVNIAGDGGQQVVATRTICARNTPMTRPRARRTRRPARRQNTTA